MKKLIAGTLTLIALSFSAYAGLDFEGNYPPNQPLQEYFAAEDQNYNKSIIYIFYNGDQCYQCPETIALIEQIYNQYYNGRYSLFVIDYENDGEYDFISEYNLHNPLSVVLVKIADGQSMGWRKIDNPQNMMDAREDFTQYLTEQINEFLGNS